MADHPPGVLAAYLGVVIIWGTTPLAIQWSGQEVGFLFGVTARMVIGVVLCSLLVLLLRLPMAWHAQALRAYLAAGLGIYGAMLCVYWGAQFIPSGWISVIFGLTPIVTGLLAQRFLGEIRLGGVRLLGILTGILGLGVVFLGGQQFSENAWQGLAAVLVAVLLHSISTVWTKRVGYHAHGLVITTGGLLVAVPLYLLSCWIASVSWPSEIPPRVAASILYLGVVATAGGFSLFFLVLRHMDATRVALLTLITPVLALWLGRLFNGEQLTAGIVTGTALILLGLVLYQYGERRLRILFSSEAIKQ